MVFVVKNPGLLSTYQDIGRYGHQSTGISPSGALDYKSAILANQLVGNSSDKAVIEMTLSGLSFEVYKDTTIGTAGAEMELKVNGKKIPIGRPISLAKGDFVEFGRTIKGLRTYLAVANGFTIEQTLGSYATHIRTAMGGQYGRAIIAGDKLPYNGNKLMIHHEVLRADERTNEKIIRIVPGPNYDDLTAESKNDLVTKSYTITRSNDRMGIRLDGEPLKTTDGVHDILSEPTQLGNIQVPKNGQPIILLNDRQTTGGYKRMASVAKIDLPKLVQLEPDTTITFEMISLKDAVALYRNEMQKILNKEYLVQDTNYSYKRRIKAERVKQFMMR